MWGYWWCGVRIFPYPNSMATLWFKRRANIPNFKATGGPYLALGEFLWEIMWHPGRPRGCGLSQKCRGTGTTWKACYLCEIHILNSMLFWPVRRHDPIYGWESFCQRCRGLQQSDFKSADGTFCRIASVDIRCHKLKFDVIIMHKYFW